MADGKPSAAEPQAAAAPMEFEQLLMQVEKLIGELQEHVNKQIPLRVHVPYEVVFEPFARHPITGKIIPLKYEAGPSDQKAVGSSSETSGNEKAGDSGSVGDGGG